MTPFGNVIFQVGRILKQKQKTTPRVNDHKKTHCTTLYTYTSIEVYFTLYLFIL